MSKARPNIPDCMKNLTTSKMETFILEANLGVEDTKIAKMYLIDQIPQVEIAEEIEITQRAVSKRCCKAINKIVCTMGNADTNTKQNVENNVIYIDPRKVI